MSLSIFFFFFLIIPPPPRSTLFPYTTLFRSSGCAAPDHPERALRAAVRTRQGVRRQRIGRGERADRRLRSEEHTSELQSRGHLVCRLLLEKKKKQQQMMSTVQNADN